MMLGAAVLALWLGEGGESAGWRGRAWVWLAMGAVAVAWLAGIVSAVGVGGVALLGVSVWAWYRRVLTRPARALVLLGVLGVSVACLLHAWPGFRNVRILDAVRLSADAVPYSLYLNFDKTLVGLVLIGWGQARVASWREAGTVARRAWPVAAGTLLVVMSLSWCSGYVRFDPKWPTWVWLWALVNLFSTCLAEEAFFRGFVQGGLTPWLGRGWALGVAAVLFGLAHAAGGPFYVGLAAVAGAGYGWVYQRTGRIEASMMTHFVLNAFHLTLFTYPALARS